VNVLEVISEIASANASVIAVRVFPFQASPLLQQRVELKSAAELALLESALMKKRNSGVPFWEALLTAVASSGLCSPSIIRAALLHQENGEYSAVPVDDIARFVRNNEAREWAANSAVAVPGADVAHIPMLDFKVPVSARALVVVQEVVRQLGLTGYILDSGRSYHFWGRNLISTQELQVLLARFVLLHPISDKSWAAHQLMEGSASLRISARYGRLPEVVGEVH
jgi:hypothetical protein